MGLRVFIQLRERGQACRTHTYYITSTKVTRGQIHEDKSTFRYGVCYGIYDVFRERTAIGLETLQYEVSSKRSEGMNDAEPVARKVGMQVAAWVSSCEIAVLRFIAERLRAAVTKDPWTASRQ